MSSSKISEKLIRQHPLQRLESPSKGFSGVVHNDSYGWHFQYLTIIGLSISTLCFTSGLLADATSSHTLFTLKNYLALVAAPIELLISLLYWGLRAIDPALVIPPDLPMLPFWTDLCFHLFPSLLLSLDAILLSPPWPTNPVNPNAPFVTLVASMAISFTYWFWIELCHSHNGFYPYPIFALLGTWQRIGLFVVSGVTMWLLGAGLRMGYTRVNGYEVSEMKKDV
ncbi:uncharacterized protein BDR25DRAFT_322844 [Lindgomyces ingoldianus]|uniref:Uncharacterized protein n=1 Tax=Lindgomyces ingoldianus TaxID=673940 RepID=A0ACB6R650_9PLEO|nr:uncharacterized protein BDR25DRAFT_322844 [Lindgomyces ingoldianus]KAF2474641.1 hypothetical protein BDR25DRAFT_322844 [Lindgomyces ingoldianus]